jgi:hypothetical protein
MVTVPLPVKQASFLFVAAENYLNLWGLGSVNDSNADRYYFQIVADYIHLNSASAGLAGGERGKLASYRWSSLACYAKGKGPPWLEMERLLKSFEPAESGRGRQAYVEWLEARAANDDGKIDPTAQDALRRGWYLGEEAFRDRLLDLVDKAKGVKARPAQAESIRVCAIGSRKKKSSA